MVATVFRKPWKFPKNPKIFWMVAKFLESFHRFWKVQDGLEFLLGTKMALKFCDLHNAFRTLIAVFKKFQNVLGGC